MDGQIADAAGVMANLNYIAGQVNSNAASQVGNFTEIGVYGGGGGFLTSATQYTIGAALPFATSVVTGDIYSEYAAGVFTPANAGLYLIAATVTVNLNATTLTHGASLTPYVNGTAVVANGMAYFMTPIESNFSLPQATLLQMISVTAGALVTLRTFTNFVFTGNQIIGNQFSMNIIRVR
jgi:hypothetical protein